MAKPFKYANREEQKAAARQRRTKLYAVSNVFNTVKKSVEEAPEMVRLFAQRNKDRHDVYPIDETNVYLYALIGVDQTIHALVQAINAARKKKGVDCEFSTSATKREVIQLLQQLRFRSWLIEKARVNKEVTSQYGFEEWVDIPNWAKRNKKDQTQQEEEEDANTTAFTESDSEQEGTL